MKKLVLLVTLVGLSLMMSMAIAYAATNSIRLIRKTYNIESIARASNVVTVTLEAAAPPHDNLKVEQKIHIAGCTNANFNMAVATITAVTSVL